jgi:hypothetical protein
MWKSYLNFDDIDVVFRPSWMDFIFEEILCILNHLTFQQQPQKWKKPWLVDGLLYKTKWGYRVHVFNPNSIHGAIEYEPISCWARINWHVPEGDRKNTIGPFMWHGVELTVKLSHSDWLWIQNIVPKTNNPWILNTCWFFKIYFIKKLQKYYMYWREHDYK